MLEYPALFVAALLAGALNSVAGGGSFLTFPALVLGGVPPIAANTTSTVALWPGALASVGAYRRELAQAPNLLLLSLASLAGGVLGALLLLRTSSATFSALVPYLLLLATLLRLQQSPPGCRPRADGSMGRGTLLALGTLQLAIATYAAIGILMLAMLGLMGMTNIHVMNRQDAARQPDQRHLRAAAGGTLARGGGDGGRGSGGRLRRGLDGAPAGPRGCAASPWRWPARPVLLPGR